MSQTPPTRANGRLSMTMPASVAVPVHAHAFGLRRRVRITLQVEADDAGAAGEPADDRLADQAAAAGHDDDITLLVHRISSCFGSTRHPAD